MATVLSIIALSISALTLLWTIGWSVYTHRRATRPGVEVSGSYATPVYGPTLGAPAVSMTVTNSGAVTITITSAAFAIQGSTETLAPIEWVMRSQPLPVVLAPGEHWEAVADEGSLRASLVHHFGRDRDDWRVRPVVTDSASRKYQAAQCLDL